ncbi:hypothetical protein [Acinetobacter sp. ANC 3882]|uniref:hypothetical protein n=1 Tax=Acinetobacter sp. ANC 3882 TaxID=2923423 RepID=UPI001F4A31DB|nr:hypothetical protein [Acinetobacter sp. ANC 3882]MCH7314928.1 hypothetical protein [Acinetobacter sp. ANC 3882]
MNFKTLNHKIFICCLLSGLVLTGCASNRVIGETTRDLYTKYESGHEWTTLIEDEVIAFGKPSSPLPNEPTNSIIIAGKQYSYVINKGGAEFIALISQLNPAYIHISRDLNFIAPAPDSNRFRGQFRFAYTPPNGNLSEKEQALFKQYGIAPCHCIDKQNPHTFELSLEGIVYPAVSNLKSLQPLSKPYRVKIQYLHYKSGKVQLSTKEKLANLPLLPFTLTLDAIALPAKVLGIIYQP